MNGIELKMLSSPLASSILQFQDCIRQLEDLDGGIWED